MTHPLRVAIVFSVIPLAKKLDRCGVFGVSHLEFLHNAQENKKEWVKKGEEITASLLERCQAKYGTAPNEHTAQPLQPVVEESAVAATD